MRILPTKKRITLAALAVLACLAVGFVLILRGGIDSQIPASSTPEGKNAYELAAYLLDPQTNLEDRLRRLPEVFDYSHFAFPGGIEELDQTVQQNVSPPTESFIEWTTFAKVVEVKARLLLLRGEHEKALASLAAMQYLRELLSHSDDLMLRAIGVAIAWSSLQGLELYALNACETVEDYDELWETLERLQRLWKPASTADYLKVERENSGNLFHRIRSTYEGNRFLKNNPLPPPFDFDMRQGYFDAIMRISMREIAREYAQRHQISDVRFQLIRIATVARWRLVSSEHYPESESDFAPLLPDGLPDDPFANPPGPLKFFTDTGNGDFVCYSVGPDGLDEKARKEVEPAFPERGGDIILRVPRERRYPFSREGIRFGSPEEILSQFPNGLPEDPFGGYSGRPLGITRNDLPVIFSYGPDNEASKIVNQADGSIRHIPYDPTNGAISRGVLFA